MARLCSFLNVYPSNFLGKKRKEKIKFQNYFTIRKKTKDEYSERPFSLFLVNFDNQYFNSFVYDALTVTFFAPLQYFSCIFTDRFFLRDKSNSLS